MSSISAGDLEKFCYCPLSWKLRDAEGGGAALVEGSVLHQRMAGELEEIVKGERRASVYETWVIAFSVLATAMALIGVFVFASSDLELRGRVLSILALVWTLLAVLVMYATARARPPRDRERGEVVVGVAAIMAMVLALNAVPIFGISTDHGLMVQAIALVLLMGASAALVMSQRQRDRTKRARQNTKVQGRIAYIGEGGSPRLLISERHGLTGRPDYIVEIDGDLVPVEVKTGRVPRGPLFSHVIQLAAYCLLLEEQEGRVSYGILRYGDVEHIVAFDENLRSLLLKKVAEMREAVASGEAHRDHDRPGKCRSCSRRSACPERLD
ncbi:MAG: CRISPR-associated protein Cas4 [Methanomassiliicoccus sp.]|nr:CRISPR-associated protein Cas4 [Methanomassiliicoccus sp.]